MTNRVFAMEKPDLNDMQHHGIKGMKWGVRRSNPSGGSSGNSKTKESGPPVHSRKELRKYNKAQKQKFYEDRTDRAIKTAMKDPTSMILTRGGDGFNVVLTGKEFTEHLAKGGAFDMRATAVYAMKKGEGPYVMDEHLNDRYHKVKVVPG